MQIYQHINTILGRARRHSFTAVAWIAFSLISVMTVAQEVNSVASATAGMHDPASGKFAELPGVRLWYQDSGGKGDVVIFLHPATGSAQSWEQQVPVLAAAGYRVITYDRRGTRYSITLPSAKPTETAIDDLQALITQLGIKKFHLVSAAAGGFVALDYAVSYQQHLKSLVISNTMGLLQDKELLEMGQRIRPAQFNSLAEEHKELSPSYKASNPAGVKRWLEILEARKSATPGWQQNRNRMTLALMETINVPTLFIAGEADPYMPPPMMRMMAARVKDAEAAVIPETSHAGFWEQPEKFNQLVLAHLKKH